MPTKLITNMSMLLIASVLMHALICNTWKKFIDVYTEIYTNRSHLKLVPQPVK